MYADRTAAKKHQIEIKAWAKNNSATSSAATIIPPKV